MNLSLLTNKQMEMRTDKFMIYVFSAIMLGGMVACSSDDRGGPVGKRRKFVSVARNFSIANHSISGDTVISL